MFTPLPTRPQSRLPIPDTGKQLPLPDRSRGPLPLPGSRKPLPIPRTPFARLRPKDIPAPRWHTFFTAVGALQAHTKVLIDEILTGAGHLGITSAAKLHDPNFSASGALFAHPQPKDPAPLAAAGALFVHPAPKNPSQFNATGFLVGGTIQARHAAFYAGSGQLSGATAAKGSMEPSGSGALFAHPQAKDPAFFAGAGSVAAVARPRDPAEFHGLGSLAAVPVSILEAKFSGLSQLYSGAYEVEILMEPNFSALGSPTAHPQAKDPAVVGGAGTLGATAQAKLPLATTAAGSLTATPRPKPMAVFTADGSLNIGVTGRAVYPDFLAEGSLAAATKVPWSRALSATGALAAATRAALVPAPAGAGSLSVGTQVAYLDNWSSSKGSTQIGSNSWVTLLQFTTTGIGTAIKKDFSVTHSWGSNALQWVTVYRRLRITVNGTQVGSYAENGHTTGGWSTTSTWNGVTLAPGDVIRIQGYGQSAYGSCRTVTISSATMT